MSILATALALADCAHLPPTRASTSRMWEALNLETTDGSSFAPSLLRGRVVLVYFMATWCFSCLGDLSVLSKAQNRLSERGLSVVGVGMDLEGRKTLEPFAKSQNLPFPLLVASPEILAGETAYGRIRGIPATYVFNRDGELVAAYNGSADPTKLLEKLSQMVHEGVLQQ